MSLSYVKLPQATRLPLGHPTASPNMDAMRRAAASRGGVWFMDPQETNVFFCGKPNAINLPKFRLMVMNGCKKKKQSYWK